MKVALNAQLLSASASYRSAGISRAIYHLLAELPNVAGDEHLHVYAPDAPANRQLLGAPHLTAHLNGLPMDRPAVRIAWEQVALPVELLRSRTDLLHALGFVSPFAWRGPTIVTTYDLSFMRFPHLFNRGNRFYLRTFCPPSLRRADRVITISEHARRDVIELCGVRPEREPRKNVELLVRAYASLRQQGSVDHVLVLAGARGWQYDPIFELVRELGLETFVRFAGFVQDDEQALWYSSATVFAFPSLYEGFGLPLLEAMACGTPVVASRASSLPEVVGDAGLLVDPSSSDELSAALRQILEDDDQRAALAAAGLARAQTFSWRRTAAETIQVYRDVLGA